MFININSVTATPGSTGGTSAAVNMTGANLLVMFIGADNINNQSPLTVTDSTGLNTWQQASADQNIIIMYAEGAHVSAAQTFTVSGLSANTYPTFTVYGFAGAVASSSLDNFNYNSDTAVTTLTSSITPADNNELIIAGLEFDSIISNLTLSAVFTSPQLFTNYAANSHYGLATSWANQATAGRTNYTYNWTGSTNPDTIAASFIGATSYSISGTIGTLAGVTVTATLGNAVATTAVTGVGGTYTLTGLPNGTYTITPTLAGYTFTPASASKTVASANITGVNFTPAVNGSATPTNGTVGAGQYYGPTLQLAFTNPLNLDIMQVRNEGSSVVWNLSYSGVAATNPMSPTAGALFTFYGASFSSAFNQGNPDNLDILQVVAAGGHVAFNVDYQGNAGSH